MQKDVNVALILFILLLWYISAMYKLCILCVHYIIIMFLKSKGNEKKYNKITLKTMFFLQDTAYKISRQETYSLSPTWLADHNDIFGFSPSAIQQAI